MTASKPLLYRTVTILKHNSAKLKCYEYTDLLEFLLLIIRTKQQEKPIMFKFAHKIKSHLPEELVVLSTTSFLLITIMAGLGVDMPLWQLWYFGLATGVGVFMLALAGLAQYLVTGYSRFMKYH